MEPFGGANVIRPYVMRLDKAGFSWAFWTWKVAPKSSLGDWGIVRPRGAVAQLDPFTDSEEQLVAKIKLLRTENMDIPAPLIGAFQH